MNFRESIALNKKIKRIRTTLQSGFMDNDLYKLSDFERLVTFRDIQIEKMANSEAGFRTKEYHRRCDKFQTLTNDQQILCIIKHNSEKLADSMATADELKAIYDTIYAA